MSFLEAIEECKFTAHRENRVVYVYENNGKFFWGAPVVFRKWLFKAYPGGRTELSIEGTKFARSGSRPTLRRADLCPTCLGKKVLHDPRGKPVKCWDCLGTGKDRTR
jgi:hypothetical protein